MIMVRKQPSLKMSYFTFYISIYNFLDLSDAFDLLDMDKDGNLSRAEVACLLRTINVDPNRNELNFIFHEMDKNGMSITKSNF